MKNLLLVIGLVLAAIGIFKPNLSLVSSDSNTRYVFVAPKDESLLQACYEVTNTLKNGPSSRKSDSLKLAQLYYDLAELVSLDETDEVIKNTAEIRQVNSIVGPMLRLNLKDKYTNLSSLMNKVMVTGLGDDEVVLDENLRNKAVETFKALGWACYEASK